MADNSFHTTVESLFKGMDSFITTKTVVGELDWVEKMMIDYETYYIIIDEVQEVEDFVEVLSSLSVTEGADV